MNRPLPVRIGHSACPHDCPSTCALDVEILDERTIGRVRGSEDMDYTAGVICAKVARYAERLHHPDRLLTPMIRTGPKGSGQFRQASWEEALDRIAEAFVKAAAAHGTEAVWPYYYAGTMGLVQRDGIHRLRHEGRYSGQFDTICTNMAWTGYIAGTGRLAGPDPREMAKSDFVVIWGTNAVATQVNVMTHATRARKERGAKIAVVDVYRNATMEQADLPLVLKPGTDAALACAVMHVLFRDGYADRAYMARYADAPEELEAHLQSRSPAWAAAITGLSVEEIETFARLIGTTKRTFLRLGYGFTRQRNGAVAMHAAASIATVAGLWQHEGGGAFHNNGAIYGLDKTLIEGADLKDHRIRALDQSRIGAVLTGDREALKDGPPVTAMLIQNTNPASVAPDQRLVARGLAREDLFVAVHEQFMTETARMADVVLPATMFLEHDDIYRGGGHQYILLGPKLVEAPGEARENHAVHVELARRLGFRHRGFSMTPREHIDWMLRRSGRGTLAELEAARFIDCQPDFETAHYLGGFAYPDGKFRFKPDWPKVKAPNDGPMGPWRDLPALPDQWNAIEVADAEHPFRLATSPARSFLNSTFNESPTGRKREGEPAVMIHPDDAARLGIGEGARVRLGNRRGDVVLKARLFDGVRPGVLVTEGLQPNAAFEKGEGINVLTGADPAAPFGGAAFHDNKVWIRLAD
ncbi:molybdopterin-containing oxidoreductase family protein [Prosthecomicrobium sp. N25]|uniref:molybdopterin-containing oxidoreductase family protein n=1 Tax=Prosthecomicrobium sp. N25 TaxID=3129254 RepID=UPI003078876D